MWNTWNYLDHYRGRQNSTGGEWDTIGLCGIPWLYVEHYCGKCFILVGI